MSAGKRIVRNVIKRHKCQPCADQQKKIMATSWCTECQVGLCTTCHRHHDSLKLTKYHHVISMRAFQSKITAGQVAQKLDKMQIQHHQQKTPAKGKDLRRKTEPDVEEEIIRETEKTEEDLAWEAKMNAVKFVYDRTIDLLKGENASIIKDIKVLSNGHIVMIDGNNNRLLVSEMGGIKQSEFPLPGKPYCLAIAPDDTAAISLYDKGKVVLVDIFNRKIFREIVMTCFGLVFTDEHLVLNCGRTGVKLIDVYGNVFETISEIKGDCYLFLGNEGHVYCNSCQSNKLICYNIRRKLVTTFSSLSIEHPLGTTTDEEGFIYEVGIQSPSVNTISFEGCKASESVHMISPTGKLHRLVLTRQDGVFNPYAVFFDQTRNILIVANEYGEKVLVFKKIHKEHSSAVA